MHRGLQVLGITVAILGAAFVARAIVRDWPVVSDALGDAAPGWMIGALIVAMMSLAWVALVWTVALRRTAPETSFTTGLSWYFPGELAKYVPGGIWSVLGRAEMAARGGVGRGDAYVATITSLAATLGAALAVAVITSPAHPVLSDVLTTGRAWVPQGTLLAGGAVVVLVMGVMAARRLLKGQARPVRGVGGTLSSLLTPRIFRLVILSLPVWLGMGFSTWGVAMALGFEVPIGEMIFATSAAWFIGFVVIPAPGGLGVREATFVWALASVSPGAASVIAVGARVISMVADLLGAMLVFATGKGTLRRRPE